MVKNEILFYAPGIRRYETKEYCQTSNKRFVPISLTGTNCELQCDHCKGNLLYGMRTPKNSDIYNLCKRLVNNGTKGILVTGGSNKHGRVPLIGLIDEFKRVKDEFGVYIVTHTGLVDKELAEGLSNAGIDSVMIDIIGSDDTIKNIYHLQKKVEDFNESLYNLASFNISIVPHIVIGLNYGKIVGEYNALEIISKYPISALVLVIIRPVLGTPMEKVEPPTDEEIMGIFLRARELFCGKDVILGCARPTGKRWFGIDKMAIDCGLNGIAYPAQGIKSYAIKKGLKPKFYESCCSTLI